MLREQYVPLPLNLSQTWIIVVKFGSVQPKRRKALGSVALNQINSHKEFSAKFRLVWLLQCFWQSGKGDQRVKRLFIACKIKSWAWDHLGTNTRLQNLSLMVTIGKSPRKVIVITNNIHPEQSARGTTHGGGGHLVLTSSISSTWMMNPGAMEQMTGKCSHFLLYSPPCHYLYCQCVLYLPSTTSYASTRLDLISSITSTCMNDFRATNHMTSMCSWFLSYTTLCHCSYCWWLLYLCCEQRTSPVFFTLLSSV